jgi:hypothetical protein
MRNRAVGADPNADMDHNEVVNVGVWSDVGRVNLGPDDRVDQHRTPLARVHVAMNRGAGMNKGGA